MNKGLRGKLSHLLASMFVLALAAGGAFSQGFICAEGGGNPNKGEWAKEVFGWMVEKSGNGRAIIIGAVPLENDERIELLKGLGALEVDAIVVDESNADDPAVASRISRCSLVFIRGGAQDRYVNWWKGKATEKAIREVFQRGGVIAGTSAGCAVLGQIVYDANVGSLTAQQAVSNPNHPNLTLTKEFLSFVPGVLFDTHFSERGRLPRLAMMLSACGLITPKPILGIGVDPRTALCIEPDGTAQVRGEGTITLLLPWIDPSSVQPEILNAAQASSQPRFRRFHYAHLASGYVLSLPSGAIISRPPNDQKTPNTHSVQDLKPDPWKRPAPSQPDASQSETKIVENAWETKGLHERMVSLQEWISQSTRHNEIVWHSSQATSLQLTLRRSASATSPFAAKLPPLTQDPRSLESGELTLTAPKPQLDTKPQSDPKP